MLTRGGYIWFLLLLTFFVSVPEYARAQQACSISQPSLTGKNGERSTISSPFGMRMHPVHRVMRFHAGVDVNTPGASDCNQPVKVQEGCTRKFYGPRGGYGNLLIVSCGNGVELYYAHLNSYNDATKTAYVGNTGIGTGCHLHYETRIDGKIVDPECVWGSGTARGRSCPSIGKPDMCNAAHREALKNHTTSRAGKGSPSNSNTGTNSTTQTTQNPNGSTTMVTRLPTLPNGTRTLITQTNNPDGSTTTSTTVTYPDGSTQTTTITVGGGVEDEDGKDDTGDGDEEDETTTVTTTPPTGTPEPPEPPEPPTPPTPSETPVGSDLVPKKPDSDDTKLSGCAVDTWTSMVNQAVLEARREVVMNQTYIVKPDSVLAYACFKHWNKSIQENAGPIFSETTRFSPQVDISSTSPRKPKQKQVNGFAGLGATSLDNALSSTVYSAADTYLNTNFNHKMLGGTTEIESDAFQCNVMQNVWKAAKCRNFATTKVFYTFDELINEDPRQFPANMKCDDTGIKQELIDWAKNKDKKVKYDPLKTHLKYLSDPSSCELSIPTGIKVHKRVEGELKTDTVDVVCSNVGCTSKSGKCQKW